jgi:hypothetical protein
VLTDPEKRQKFDNGEDPLDPESVHQQGWQNFHQGFGGFNVSKRLINLSNLHTFRVSMDSEVADNSIPSNSPISKCDGSTLNVINYCDRKRRLFKNF